MDRIARMCKYTNYEDMTVIITTIGEGGLEAKHRIKFGKGWMGRNAEIRGANYLYGGPKVIIIFITISESRRCGRLPARKSKRQNPPRSTTDITNNWFHTSMSWAEWSGERARRAEEEEILVEMRIGEMEMLEEMQAEAEVREALYGQIDEISDMFEGLAV
jgi:hypothetical protein